MKQHITMEQLSELTAKQQEKLRAWIGDPQKNCTRMSMTPDEQVAYELYFDLPQLSIGQMIEFLANKGGLGIFLKKNNGGEIDLLLTSNGECLHINTMCDVLWEQVKNVLEQ